MRVILLVTVILAYQIHSYGVLGLSVEDIDFEEVDVCAPLNTSCEECVAGLAEVKCYWCGDKCLNLEGVTNDACPLDEIKLGQCRLTGLALVVIVSGGVFVLLVAGCVVFGASLYCYCRFCRKWKRARTTQTRVDSEMSEMQERHTRRQSERTARGDELRRKYGLVDEDDTSKYQRL